MGYTNPDDAKKAYESRLTKLRDVNKKARELYEAKIQKLHNPDLAYVMGVPLQITIYQFCRAKGKIRNGKTKKQSELRTSFLVLLLVMDMYHVFLKTDVLVWGLTGFLNKAKIFLTEAEELGLISKQRIIGNKFMYFVAAGGRDILNKFYAFHDERIKTILENNKDGNFKQIYPYSYRPERRYNKSI